jgi:hypothetical protein
MAQQGDGRRDDLLVTPDMLLPDMVAKFPATRQVLDKYGLKGCGGPTGPREPVAWFARLHNVPLQQLLDELNEAARQSLHGGETTIRFEPTFADTIYQPYFTAAAFLAVVFGALWGTVSLAVMGITGGMQFAIPYGWLLAHGQTMLGGFVVLMAMGFAFQAFPRFKHSELQLPHLALAALPLLLLGIALQALAHFFVPPPMFQTAQPVVHWSFAHWSLPHWALSLRNSSGRRWKVATTQKFPSAKCPKPIRHAAGWTKSLAHQFSPYGGGYHEFSSVAILLSQTPLPLRPTKCLVAVAIFNPPPSPSLQFPAILGCPAHEKLPTNR